ncbi:hypothetical protein GH714_021674 [Hevea brasiliensis]|uniref:Uncharacterized protein n=1 Tax=Hevea brasiliensis TaxID=3981 RepID=A0A6A6N3U6_HEVBR|nr:hypothetical protein GH714_021674 [Hevea brasiliensis]
MLRPYRFVWVGEPLGSLKLMDLSESDDLIRIPNCLVLPQILSFYIWNRCIKLNKKVMEDVFEAHLLGQKVTLLMAGGEVPERMRYKNKGSSLSFKVDLRHVIAFSFCVVLRPYGDVYFPGFEVDFICESGNRRERNAFNLSSYKDFANWSRYGGPYDSDFICESRFSLFSDKDVANWNGYFEVPYFGLITRVAFIQWIEDTF